VFCLQFYKFHDLNLNGFTSQHAKPNIATINIKNKTPSENDTANSLLNPIITNKNTNTASLVPIPDMDMGIIVNKLDIVKQTTT